VNGKVAFTDDFQLQLKEKGQFLKKKESIKKDKPICPKCKKGQVLKGNTAYGCSRWQEGCDFRFAFDEIRRQAKGKTLTKNLVLKIITG